MSTFQERNPDLVEILRPEFQLKEEPQFSWRALVSMFETIPALRGMWPMAPVYYTAANQVRDESNQALHMTANNVPLFGYENLIPYVDLDGTNQDLTRADGGAANWADIIGTEAYIVSAQRGMTLGGWFYFDNNPGAAVEYLMGKTAGAGNRQWRLWRRTAASGGFITFSVSTDGINWVQVNTAASISGSAWIFVVGRFDPSTELKVWVNDVSATLAVGVPATIFDTAANVGLGSFTTGGFMDGKISIAFLSACLVSDTIIDTLFQQTRVMYNVEDIT